MCILLIYKIIYVCVFNSRKSVTVNKISLKQKMQPVPIQNE